MNLESTYLLLVKGNNAICFVVQFRACPDDAKKNHRKESQDSAYGFKYLGLQLPNNVDIKRFKTQTNLLMDDNHIMHSSKIYHEQSGIALKGFSSNMLADLFLYYYEKKLIS